MAVLKPKQIREMNQEEQQTNLQQLNNELMKEKAAVSSGTRPENPGKIRQLRRSIARIITIQKEPKKVQEKITTKKKSTTTKKPEVENKK